MKENNDTLNQVMLKCAWELSASNPPEITDEEMPALVKDYRRKILLAKIKYGINKLLVALLGS